MQPTTGQSTLSIMDIVTFGYKKAMKVLSPVSLLCLPAVICLALGTACIESLTITDHSSLFRSISYQVLAILPMYISYAIARYVKDEFWSDAQPNPLIYLLPDKTLIGILGVGFLTVFYGIGAWFFGSIGLLFLLLPGIIIFSYFYMWSGMFYTVYLLKPQEGIWGARRSLIRLFKGHFWRTVGMGFMTCMVCMLLIVPTFLGSCILAFLKEQPPSFMQNYHFVLAYTVFMAVVQWASYINFTGYCFILNRYYQALQARLDESVKTVVSFNPLVERQDTQNRQTGS